MRRLTLSIGLLLLFNVTGYAANSLEEQLQNHAERIDQLEYELEELKQLLGAEQFAAKTSMSPPSDELIGRWDCTDGAFSAEVYFEAGGQLLQKEPVLGTTKSTHWTRLSHNKLSLSSGRSFKLEFYSRNQFTVEDTNTRSTWTCDRLNN